MPPMVKILMLLLSLCFFAFPAQAGTDEYERGYNDSETHLSPAEHSSADYRVGFTDGEYDQFDEDAEQAKEWDSKPNQPTQTEDSIARYNRIQEEAEGIREAAQYLKAHSSSGQ